MPIERVVPHLLQYLTLHKERTYRTSFTKRVDPTRIGS